MKNSKSYYFCTECEYRTPKWMGKCPSCGAWNTMEEHVEEQTTVKSGGARSKSVHSRAVSYRQLGIPQYIRSMTGMSELDRVLGGGIVEGSVVLIAGEPGIGKSTLLMQICDVLSQQNTVLYVSGEESAGQLKYRAERLEVSGENLYILTETNTEDVLSECEEINPRFVIIDSVQTMYCDGVSSSAGSVTQIKESTMRFISLAKRKGISILIVGHVNKEGSVAGPKVLEHMVDAVLSFEGDREQAYRIIRASKNRYGSTNEIGVFEMTGQGLKEVPNPSEMLLSGRPDNISGNCAVCVMEGTRPLITEIQALVSKSVFPSPKRTANGIDNNRMFLLLAVLEKRLGLRFSLYDAYLNVIGGIRFEEPAADLAVALALISSIRDIPVPEGVIAFGEIGLAGEIRAVNAPDQRVNEAVRLGFTKILLPKRNAEAVRKTVRLPDSVELVPVKSVFEAIKILSSESNNN